MNYFHSVTYVKSLTSHKNRLDPGGSHVSASFRFESKFVSKFESEVKKDTHIRTKLNKNENESENKTKAGEPARGARSAPTWGASPVSFLFSHSFSFSLSLVLI